jgi:RNA polymerase sigma factor (sigma-70 family)
MSALSASAQAGDVGDLYRRLAPALERIVRLDVRAPDAVIEDACSFAWIRLLHHRDRVRRDAALAWLTRTAVHEAFKLIRRAGRETSIDAAEWLCGGSAQPEEVLERRERLERIAALPARQQRLLWLHAFGLSYAEMAAHEGCTLRTVERQLVRAKHRIVAEGDETPGDAAPGPRPAPRPAATAPGPASAGAALPGCASGA